MFLCLYFTQVQLPPIEQDLQVSNTTVSTSPTVFSGNQQIILTILSMDSRLQHSLSLTNSRIQTSPSKQEFFAVRRTPRRLKQSDIITPLPQKHPQGQTSPTRLFQLRDCHSSQGKHKENELVSTFGSDNFLNFRTKPPKRKRKRVLENKTSLTVLPAEESESDNEGPPLIVSERKTGRESQKTRKGVEYRRKEVEESRKQTEFNRNEAKFTQKEVAFLQKEASSSQKVYVGREWGLDEFDVLQKIGEGTYSQVFRAVERRSGFICSLKVLNKDKMRRLKVEQNVFRQIRITLFLNHPNIMALYGCFSDQDSVYLICELASDGSLYDALGSGQGSGQGRTQRRLEVDMVKNYIKQLCQALRHLHGHMILHRDVKPQNMLISFSSTIKLCDFGWSLHNPKQALRSTFCGTPLYLAPELIQQHSYDQAVDVWAVGIITYELLTGEMPFRIRSIRDLAKVVTEQIDFRKVGQSVAVGFISCALKKRKEERKSISEICRHPFLQQSLDPLP